MVGIKPGGLGVFTGHCNDCCTPSTYRRGLQVLFLFHLRIDKKKKFIKNLYSIFSFSYMHNVSLLLI